MLTGFPRIFLEDTKIIYDSNFLAPFKKVKTSYSHEYSVRNIKVALP